jgi:hypothetical protein
MKNILKELLLGACTLTLAGLAVNPVFAQEVQRTETEERVQEGDYSVGVTNFAVRPSAGAIFFDGNERFAGGLLIDMNFLSTPVAKIGPSTGALYSSLSGNDFFSGVSTNNSNYIIQVPANLKATIAPDDSRRWQFGAHGGANIIRTSVGGVFGETTGTGLAATGGGNSWDVHPNVGGDIDFALGTNADLSLRPDVTFLDEFTMVTTTLGLALKL